MLEFFHYNTKRDAMHNPTKKRLLHRILTSRGVLVIEVILIAIILVGIAKEVTRRVALKREIQALEQQIATLRAQNQSLGEYVASIDTDTFREREARKRLNLQLPGETLLILPDEQNSTTVATVASAESASTTNPQRWWHFFFQPQS